MEKIPAACDSSAIEQNLIRVLLIADYLPLVRALRHLFEEEGFEFDAIAAPDDMTHTLRYDVVIIDAMRTSARAPVHSWCHIPGTATLLLTSPRGAKHLFPFADDELVKPFEVEELLSRTRALARSHGTRAPVRDRKSGRRAVVERSA